MYFLIRGGLKLFSDNKLKEPQKRKNTHAYFRSIEKYLNIILLGIRRNFRPGGYVINCIQLGGGDNKHVMFILSINLVKLLITIVLSIKKFPISPSLKFCATTHFLEELYFYKSKEYYIINIFVFYF